MTAFYGHPEIEPLSDISWQRIENGVFSRLDQEPAAPVPRLSPPSSGTRRLVVAGAVAAVAAAAVLMLVLRSDEGASTNGAAEVRDTPTPATPSRVVTTDAPSRYDVADSAITIAPRSAILVSKDTRDSVLIVLERGEIDCKVAPRRDRQTFAVQAGEVRIEVVGTAFAVSRSGDDVSVRVTEGTVDIVSRGDRARVTAPNSWPPTKKRERRERKKRPRERKTGDAPPPKPPTAKERYRAALRLQSTDPAAAAAIFRELAKRGGAWGRNAMFAHAQLELELGNEVSATRLLNKYLRKYPDGPNAKDARELLRDLN